MSLQLIFILILCGVMTNIMSATFLALVAAY